MPKLLKVALPERSPPKVITGDLLIVTAEAISPPSIFSETPVPEALNIASSVSKSVFIELPQVSSAAPGSGLIKFKFVVFVSAIKFSS